MTGHLRHVGHKSMTNNASSGRLAEQHGWAVEDKTNERFDDSPGVPLLPSTFETLLCLTKEPSITKCAMWSEATQLRPAPLDEPRDGKAANPMPQLGSTTSFVYNRPSDQALPCPPR